MREMTASANPEQPLGAARLAERAVRVLMVIPVGLLLILAVLSQWVGPSAVLAVGAATLAGAVMIFGVAGIETSHRLQVLLLVGAPIVALAALVLLSRPDVQRVVNGQPRMPTTTAVTPEQITTRSGSPTTPADLRGAHPTDAIRTTDLRSARLDGAVLNGLDLHQSRLDGASLAGASLRGASLRGASLRAAYLEGADLSGADLSGACLRGAQLRTADLHGARLTGADVGGAALPPDTAGVAFGLGPSESTGARVCSP
jgi:hypothetical protein